MTAEKASIEWSVVDATCCACKDNVFEAVIQGVPEGRDFLDIIENCYPKFDFKHALWDFRQSSVSGLSYEDFQHIAEATAPFAEKRGADAKTAVLVTSESDVLLFRAFSESVKDILTCDTRAFLDEDAARAWLRD